MGSDPSPSPQAFLMSAEGSQPSHGMNHMTSHPFPRSRLGAPRGMCVSSSTVSGRWQALRGHLEEPDQAASPAL